MGVVKSKGGNDKMNRRAFLTKSAGCATGLAFMAFPGIMAGILEAKGGKSREELLKELDEKVNKFMPKYKACSSASFAVLNDQFKLKADQAIRPLMPFAGGIAARGETCGAVSGCVLAMGYFFEPSDQKANKMPGSSMKFVGMFCNRFMKAFGSTRCKEVVKHQYGRYYDLRNPEDQKQFVAVSQKTGKCKDVVKTAVKIAAEIIMENS